MNPISCYRQIQFGTFCRSEFNSIASKARRWKIIKYRKTDKSQTKNVVGSRVYFLKVIIFFMLLFYFFWLTSCKQVWVIVISYRRLAPVSNHDGNDKENFWKAKGLMSKQLCTCITFFGTFISFPSRRLCSCEVLATTSTHGDESFFLFVNFCSVLQNSILEKKNCLRLTNWWDWNDRELSLKFTFCFGCRSYC